MKDIEIEIKVRISNVGKLEAFLKKEATFNNKSYQKDEYFTPAHRNFAEAEPVAEWLRLRESEPGSITYKRWHYGKDGKSEYADEYETSVGDIEQMRKIFTVLDIRPMVTVEKTRRTWHYQEYEIALDNVIGLGDFVEVEYKGKVQSINPKLVATEMIAFLKSVGCGKIERNREGYPYMLLYPEKIKFEVV